MTAKLAALAGATIGDSLFAYLSGRSIPKQQDGGRATFAKRLTKDSGRIDWTRPATGVERLIRAMAPWPGAWTELIRKGAALKVRVLSGSVSSEAVAGRPGHIALTGTGITVACGKGAVSVSSLQPSGKKPMPATAFANGYLSDSNNPVFL
jgi:methionyl-tRNA formyltransferase